MDTNDYFYVNLNTLSQIEEYDKLGLKNIDNEVKLIVDKGSYLSFITRKYNGYDRLSVINYLKDFINKLEKYVDLLVKGNLEDYAKVILPIIKTALIGLTNLKSTYVDDSNIVSEISLIIIKLESFVQQLNEITIVLNCVNDERS